MAYKLAIRKGYMDNNSNGKPDVMERPYKVNYNDCSTGNAHVACMFNDECTEEFGVLLGMRSNFKRHATTLFRGRNGQEFECDFTPGSSGISIRHVADTRIGPAFPDPDESMDPAYDCELNGASTSPLNPWGGSGGMGNLASMLSLLQMMRANQEQEELEQDALQGTPTPALPPLEELTPSPTPTATPTPQPTPRPALIDVSEDADTGAQKVGAITPDFDFAPLDFETPRNRRAAELPVPESAELPSNANSDPSLGRTKRSLDSWEDDRGDIFESRN